MKIILQVTDEELRGMEATESILQKAVRNALDGGIDLEEGDGAGTIYLAAFSVEVQVCK